MFGVREKAMRKGNEKRQQRMTGSPKEYSGSSSYSRVNSSRSCQVAVAVAVEVRILPGLNGWCVYFPDGANIH